MTLMNFPLQRDTLPAVVLRKAGHTVYQRHTPFSPQWFKVDALCFFLLLLSLAFVPLVVPQAIHAETFVSGEVSGVWDVDGSPYLVTDTLIVPEGETLLIEPGVEVIFQDQTDSTRTPVYVFGTLEAAGEEGDSVYFHTAGAAFRGFVSPFEYEDSRIAFNYCVMDSVLNGIESDRGENVIRQSRIRALNAVIFSSFGVQMDTVEYNIFQHAPLIPGQLLYLHLYNGVLRYNDGPDVWVRLCPNTGQNLASIENNSFFSLYVDLARYGGEAVEIRYNHLARADLSAGEMYWHHNESGCFAVSGWADMLIENSTFLYLDMWMATGTIRNNHVIETGAIGQNRVGIEISQCGPVDVIDNLIINFQTGIVVHTSPVSRIEGNTVYFRDTGLELRNLSDNEGEIVENILLGDDVNCTGIVFISNPVPLEISYNCIYAVSEVADGLDLDDTNLLTNPIFAGGEPFDYTLQANSPCIDAGDPDSPDDPDGTPADIGCYYYDQSLDNPPVVTVPSQVQAQVGQPVSIIVTATDDNGPLAFSFTDLPEWLSEEDELDWVGDTTIVSGTVPDSTRDFTFRVIVQDGLGQTDTAEVFVNTDLRTLLSGEITGILHVEDSPFYVVEDIIVSEGDSLIIEPGCELQFRYVEDEEYQIGIDVYGQLIAEGTVEDSIRFTSELEESNHSLWKGIALLDSQLMSRISYSVIEKAGIAVELDSASILNLKYTRLFDNYMSVYLLSSSQVQIDSCLFVSQVPEFIMYVFLNASDIEITNSVFWNQYESSPAPSAIRCVLNSTALIQGNEFFNCEGIRFDESSHGEVFRNRFFNVPLGMCFTNSSSGYVANNLFENHDWGEADGVWITPDLEVLFANNVFTGFECGVDIFGSSEGENSVQFFSNLFMHDSIAIFNRAVDDTPILYQYNCFCENDTNNINIPWNILNITISPLLEDTIHYRLTDESPLINAGHPDSVYFDCDSTRNDIGLWGGPYGLSYTYPLTVRENEAVIPSIFEIHCVYPNPFNSTQTVVFALPHQARVQLTLFNILGQPVFAIDWPQLQPGIHRKSYNASGLASGVYFIQLETEKEVRTTRVLLIK